MRDNYGRGIGLSCWGWVTARWDVGGGGGKEFKTNICFCQIWEECLEMFIEMKWFLCVFEMKQILKEVL